jgi:phosphate starvation-inducible PhoH-like protein
MGRKMPKLEIVKQDDEFALPRKAARQKYPQPEKTGTIWFKHKLIPRTYNQEFYLQNLQENQITMCAGPAGTGKTMIVTRVALEMLASNQVSKIVVTKPILEAGDEELGFLPGSENDKILPHFQSILDQFEEHVGPTILKRLLDSGKITFLPTAFARGRDIKHAFILIDEAQNLTKKGIKTMMTRISEGSVMALNGDSDQIDLKKVSDSGFEWAIDRLVGRDGNLGVCRMTDDDIQRHPLVQLICKALRD